MATNKIHYGMFLLFGLEYSAVLKARKCTISFDKVNAAKVTTPDSMRCWSGNRGYSHFTINPSTKQVSGMVMPTVGTEKWSEDLVKYAKKYDAGKPGNAVVDEATIPEAFWDYNDFSLQNFLFYLHLIQDTCYDRLVRAYIDFSKMYDENPTFMFQGKAFSADDLRGKGMNRWNGDGLLNQIDAQFYVRVAKRYFEKTGVRMNRQWIEDVMKPSIFKAYSPELAEKTVKFISVHDKAEEVITNGCFDEACWPLDNAVVDKWIDWMLEDMLNAVLWAIPKIY